MKKQELAAKLQELITKLNKNPNDFFINVEIGGIYYELKEYESALGFYKKALAINPSEVALNLSIGLAYSKIKDFDSAVYCYEQILKHDDNSEKFLKIKAGAYLNLANINYDTHNFYKSIELLEKAINLSPKYSDLYLNLGNCYSAENNIEKAAEFFKKAIELDKNNAEAYYNLGELQLISGDFKNGFANYEYRILRLDNTFIEPPNFKKPRWQGENPKAKTIFVYSEQGFGDAIQFSRFFYELKQRGAKVLYNSREALSELFKSSELICPEIIPPNQHKTDKNFESNFDYYIPLMSLALVLGITKDTIPFSSAYIFANTEKTEKFKNILQNDKNKFKIGIKWRGNTNRTFQRAIELKEFYTLCDIPNISFYSFQKDALPEEFTKVPFNVNGDLVKHFNDFLDTAGALANMDLVITNDSSIAHLGGAMGIKTLILLPYLPDWRWGLKTDSSPWYDSVKLFRQKTIGDWSEVFSEVKKELLNIAS